METLKQLWINWGWSHPFASSVVVAGIAVATWWLFGLLVTLATPQSPTQDASPAQSASPSSPATPQNIQQSAIASGSSTINQAGRDVVINSGISDQTMKELLRDKSNAANMELIQKYPYGYVLLGIANGKIIYEPNLRRFRVEADWENWRISINPIEHRLRLFMSRISIVNDRGNRSFYANEIVEVPYGEKPEGESFDTMHGADRGVGIYFEIIDLEKWIFLIGFKQYQP